MIERGRVLAFDDEHVWVETVRKSACGSCEARNGCGQSLLQSLHPEREDSLRLLRDNVLCADLNINDTVEFSVPDHLISQSAALLYLLPLVAMLAVVIPGAQVGLGDLAVAGLGLLAMLAGFALTRFFLDRGSDKQLLPTIVAVHAANTQQSAEYVKLL